MKRRSKGLLITVEGGDGAGKTTLLKGLFSALEKDGFSVLVTREPGGTFIGQQIRHLLLDKRSAKLATRAELLLFLADRAQHVEEVILPALCTNQIVLCDRFNDSTYAYQGGARGFDMALLHSLCAFASQSLIPDLTLYLDLDPAVGVERVNKERGNKDRMESETLLFHRRIRRAFRRLAVQDPQRILLLDASQSQNALFEAAKSAVYAKLQ